MIFTDHTYYELYSGANISFAGGIDKGGRKEALRYMSSAMDVIAEFPGGK